MHICANLYSDIFTGACKYLLRSNQMKSKIVLCGKYDPDQFGIYNSKYISLSFRCYKQKFVKQN